MTDQTDSLLLKAYVERGLEAAFDQLVHRHVDLVYSAAIRMVRDPHLAEDVTQGAFIALAKQASELVERATLAGWLHSRSARAVWEFRFPQMPCKLPPQDWLRKF